MLPLFSVKQGGENAMPGTSLVQTPTLDFCRSGHFRNSEDMNTAYFHRVSLNLAKIINTFSIPPFKMIVNEKCTKLRFVLVS